MVQKVKQIIILHRDISKLMFFIVPGLKWMQLPPRQLRHKVLPILEVLGDPIVYLVAPHIFVHLDLDSQVLLDRPDLCLCEKSTRMDFSKGCLTMRKRARHWANSWKQTGKKKISGHHPVMLQFLEKRGPLGHFLKPFLFYYLETQRILLDN